jgi:hypothetical protein
MKKHAMLIVLAISATLAAGCCNEEEVEECLSDCYSFAMQCYAQVSACPGHCQKDRSSCYLECRHACEGDSRCEFMCNDACDEAHQWCRSECVNFSACDEYNYACEQSCPEENAWCHTGGGCSGGCY